MLYYPLHDVTCKQLFVLLILIMALLFSGDVVPTAMWNIVEVHITIICAALIACKPVVSRLLSATPFSSMRSIWSRLRSQFSIRGFGSSSHVRTTDGTGGGWTNLSQPQSALPLHDIKRTREASSDTRDLQNATSTHEIYVQQTFDVRDDNIV